MASADIPARPLRIFLSYRREDTADAAGRLCDALGAHFPKRNIFMDVDTIEPGEKWTAKIDEALDACDVLICLIGQHWVSVTDHDGRRRLDHPDDRHRREVEAALRRDIIVIPVLVQDARMPSSDDLPEPLKGLAERQATRLDHVAYQAGVRLLVRRIKGAAREQTGRQEPSHASRRARERKIAGVATGDEVDGQVTKRPKSGRRRTVPLLLLALLTAAVWWWFGDLLETIRRVRQVVNREQSETSSGVHPDSLPLGKTFADCEQCPQMVVIPPGSFEMGWASNDELPTKEGIPQHRVTVGRGLAVGRYEVTREEYAEFLSETGRSDEPNCQIRKYEPNGPWVEAPAQTWRSPGFAQSPRDPLVCVSWDDARAYVSWLSQKTGFRYRLLSEAEWEYAARAGTKGARYLRSDDPATLCSYINHGDQDYSDRYPTDLDVNHECRDGYPFTSPVGQFPPNPFRLYDMLGNVWEWVEDCWNEDYVGAPSDGSAWTSGDCSRRVLRGGAWKFSPEKERSAYRVAYVADFRHNSVGFRVARSL